MSGDFVVSTRRGSAAWADSVLPPSPRSATRVESGHLTTAQRRPSLGKTAVGTKAPPQQVMPSDRALSPRGWLAERAAMAGELSFEDQSPHPQRGRSQSAAHPEMKRAAKQAAQHFQHKARIVLLQREQGWNSAPYKPAPVKGIKPQTVEPWAAAEPWESAPGAATNTLAEADDPQLQPPGGGLSSVRAAAIERSLGATQRPADLALPDETEDDDDMGGGRTPTAKRPSSARPSSAGRAGSASRRPVGSSSSGASSARRAGTSSKSAFAAASSPGAPSSAAARPWDSSPFRATPKSLRGLKPVTREPWAFDQASVPIYRDGAPPGPRGTDGGETEDGGDGTSSALSTARCSEFSATSSAEPTPRNDAAGENEPSSLKENAANPNPNRQLPIGGMRGKDSARGGGGARSARDSGVASARSGGLASTRSSGGLGSARSSGRKAGSGSGMSSARGWFKDDVAWDASNIAANVKESKAVKGVKPAWQGLGGGLARSFHMPSWERWAYGLNR